jgi:hypothetical protein
LHKKKEFDSVSMVARTKQEVGDIINRFIDKTGGNWEWDDFCSLPIADPDLDLVRVKCSGLGSTHPPTENGHFCNENGILLMRNMIHSLRNSGKVFPENTSD